MTTVANSIRTGARARETLSTDGLSLGGGPAGTWAAVEAARQGVGVVLVDKGFCGTSGAAAPSGNGVWYVADEPTARESAKASREALGGFLQDRAWMDAVLDQTWSNVNLLADWNYPFPRDEDGKQRRGSLQGPEYLRLMRRQVLAAGARILDHSPALELLVDGDGAVAGARGYSRVRETDWEVRAKAVVVATGGCAFLSRALGCNVLTGDGYLMAGELGAELSGMEFSNAYGISPVFSSVTKTAFYRWATFFDHRGEELEGASGHHRSKIAKALLEGAVYAQLDQAPEDLHASLRAAQPNFFLPFDRVGIDPFRQRFQVTLRLEGTVRGTGGLRLVDRSCATTVPGLFAAGDAASREPICGGFTGGGSHNAAWALSTGAWSGRSAALHALSSPARSGAATGGSEHRESRKGLVWTADAVIKAVQGEVFPYDRNYFRSGPDLDGSLARLDNLWRNLAKPAPGEDPVRIHEARSMLATARWMYTSALSRTESRGMHKRTDFPALDPNQQHHLVARGVDSIELSSRSAARAYPRELLEKAAA